MARVTEIAGTLDEPAMPFDGFDSELMSIGELKGELLRSGPGATVDAHDLSDWPTEIVDIVQRLIVDAGYDPDRLVSVTFVAGRIDTVTIRHEPKETLP